jgi:hypothetical protein
MKSVIQQTPLVLDGDHDDVIQVVNQLLLLVKTDELDEFKQIQ